MDAHQLTTILQTVGFPIFVAVWFMLRIEKHLSRNTSSNAKVLAAIAVLAKTLSLSEKDQEKIDNLLDKEEGK